MSDWYEQELLEEKKQLESQLSECRALLKECKSQLEKYFGTTIFHDYKLEELLTKLNNIKGDDGE